MGFKKTKEVVGGREDAAKAENGARGGKIFTHTGKNGCTIKQARRDHKIQRSPLDWLMKLTAEACSKHFYYSTLWICITSLIGDIIYFLNSNLLSPILFEMSVQRS